MTGLHTRVQDAAERSEGLYMNETGFGAEVERALVRIRGEAEKVELVTSGDQLAADLVRRPLGAAWRKVLVNR